MDEIEEHPDAAEHLDNRGHWNPSTDENSHKYYQSPGLVSGSLWYCNGQQIRNLGVSPLPATSKHYKTMTMYYCAGLGFWILDTGTHGLPNHDLMDDSEYVFFVIPLKMSLGKTCQKQSINVHSREHC